MFGDVLVTGDSGRGGAEATDEQRGDAVSERTVDGAYRGMSVQAMPAHAADKNPFYIATIADHIKRRS
ncbi:hypothetical protein BRC75_05640 [Halobacteriales archaeon QH_7_69_31]|nr:MAG: hypothetical protein BRC75_05640 [Halobacteriales archaeon QH_7_69_31]